MPKRKASQNIFTRGQTLWGRVKIRGRDHKFSLRTSDIATARPRLEAERERLKAAAYYGDDRKRFKDVVLSWAQYHIAHEVSEKTAKRYASSLRQMEPYFGGLHLDE